MRIERKRLVRSAAVAAVFTTLMWSSQLLRAGGVDFAGFLGALLATGLVFYLGWPGLEGVWGQRDETEDRKRLLMAGLGLSVGFVLVQAASAVVGQEGAMWPLVLMAATLAAVFIAVVLQVRRARRDDA